MDERNSGKTATIGFVLTQGFPLIGLTSVIEPFHGANVHPDFPGYRLRTLSAGATTSICARNGLAVTVDGAIGDPAMTDDLDILFVIAPRPRPVAAPNERDIAETGGEALSAALRQLAARGMTIGGVDGGVWTMAEAGLLDGHAATIHPHLHDAFAAAFPAVALERHKDHVIDRGRLSVGRGFDAGIALVTQLILEDHDWPLAQAAATAAQMNADEVPAGGEPDLRTRHGTGNRVLLRALAAMEAHIGEPLDRVTLAAGAQVSVRQLERLFRERLHATIDSRYREIRLDRAAALVRETGMGMNEIAAACGFATPQHFTRAFRERFSIPPSAARGFTPSAHPARS